MLPASGSLRFGYLRVKQRKHVRRPLPCLGRPLNSPGLNSPMVISPASASPRPLRRTPGGESSPGDRQGDREATIGDGLGNRWELSKQLEPLWNEPASNSSMKMGMGKAFGYEKEVIRSKDSFARLSVDAERRALCCCPPAFPMRSPQ